MQVTMALEAVSASRVRRATAQVLASRAYADLAMSVLSDIANANQSGTPLHPLLASREGVGTITVILITSDRGLAGAYNSNIIRVARQFTRDYGKTTRWIGVGRKGRDALVRGHETLIADFTNLPAWLKVDDVRPIARVAIDDYLGQKSDEVYIAYTDFINTLTQQPRIQRLLPLIPGEAGELGGREYMKVIPAPESKIPDFIYEPSAAGILDEIVPKSSSPNWCCSSPSWKAWRVSTARAWSPCATHRTRRKRWSMNCCCPTTRHARRPLQAKSWTSWAGQKR